MPDATNPQVGQSASAGESAIVDLFAGPGGWSEGLQTLGRSELGIEWDATAVATARAAGHARRQADVAALDPLEFAPCEGLIASPPCQAWSMAGKGGGRRDVEHVIACALEIAVGNDTRAEHAAKCEDPRSILVVEPLRWIVALEPEWVACEQVPPVLELWSLFAQVLGARGYSTWTGVLEAERYGVPQTRERAILMARKGQAVQPPRPTHQRYVPGQLQRHDVTLDGEILPWVSMAQALGWDEGPSPSPSPSVTSGGGSTGGVEVFASKAARARAADAVTFRATNDRPNGATREASAPAPALAFGHNAPVWLKTTFGEPGERHDGSTKQPTPADVPAPTIDTKARAAEWIVDTGNTRSGSRPQGRKRATDSPAPAVTSRADQLEWRDEEPETTWPAERPSTNINCDPRVSAPGRHDPADSGSQQRNAIRVTVQEAAILQSFRPDYPWQGSRTKQFEQVGNAVPPLLSRAVLGELVPSTAEVARAA